MEPTPAQTDSAAANGIFWVEGHPDNREFLVVFLGMAGYLVTSCDSIPQASQLVRDRQFDIYIIGDCLPHGSNLPLAAEIKSINPNARVILYSALAFASDIDRGLNAGAHAYITKPGNLDYLLATIKSLLNGRDPSPTDSGRPQSHKRSSGQSSAGIQAAGEGLLDAKPSDRILGRRRLAIIAKPTMQPRRIRRGALGPG